jgi:hypothetical protein
VGDSRLGSLQPPADQAIWQFAGQANAVLSIQVGSTSPEFDAVVQLFGPDGTLIARDDNSGGGRNALISGVTLPTDGTYLIQASGKGHTGDYTIIVQAGNIPTPTPPPPPTPGPSPTPTPTAVPVAEIGSLLKSGETVQGTISLPGQRDRYVVFGPAGTVISIAMFRADESALVPAFEVFAPNGEQVVEAKGAAGAIVVGYTLSVTGAYIIYPHDAGNIANGTYSLTIGDGLSLRNFHPGAAQLGEANQGSLRRTGDRDVWLVDLAAQTTFAVEVTPLTAAFQPVVEVVGPDGKQLGVARTNATVKTAKLGSLFAPTQGKYQIRVSSVPGTPAGQYTMSTQILRIDPTATFSVAVNEMVQGEVQPNERYTYSFKGTSGVLILIDVRGIGSFDPVVVLYGPSGQRLALVDDSSADGTDGVIQLVLEDGPGAYTVQIYGYAMTGGAFMLRVKSE